MIDIAASRWTAIAMRCSELRQRLVVDQENYMEIMAEYRRACEIKLRWYHLILKLVAV